MIVFNGIELDYIDDDLFPLIIDASLGEIQNINDRKGKASRTFKVPNTQTNALAFANVGVDGGTTTISGDCKIYVENMLAYQGTLFVAKVTRAYEVQEYECNFVGSEISLINNLKRKYLRDLPLPIISLSDANILTSLSQSHYENFGYVFTHPQISKVTPITATKLGILYSIQRLVKEIFFFEGYFYTSGLFVSAIMDSDYMANKTISSFLGEGNTFNYSGDSASANVSFATGASGTPPTLEKYLQGSTYQGSGITKGSDGYTFNRDCSQVKVKVDLDYNLIDEVDYVETYISIRDGSDWRYISDIIRITESQNKVLYANIDLDVVATNELYIVAKYYFKSGTSAPYTGASIDVNSVVISTNAVEEGDKIRVATWLPDITQYEFIRGVMQHFNLVMDLDNDGVVYFDCRNNSTAFSSIGAVDEDINGIITNEFDITNFVSQASEVEIEVAQNRYYSFEQEVDAVGTINSKPIEQYKKPLSKLVDLGSNFFDDVTEYQSPFKLYFGDIDAAFLIGVGADNQITAVDSWELFICELAGFSAYQTSLQTYTKLDTTTTNVNFLLTLTYNVMMERVADFFFTKTIEQLLGKRIVTATLKVNRKQANQINFRTKIIYKDQVYQLNNYSYKVEDGLMKVELILL